MSIYFSMDDKVVVAYLKKSIPAEQLTKVNNF